MNSDPEDDALSWEGDDALDASRPQPRRERPKRPAAQPAAEAVEPVATPASESVGAPQVSPDAAQPASGATAPAHKDDEQPEGIGTVTLLLLGIFGGIYLLYTVGWAIGGVGMQTKAFFMMPALLYQVSMWIAVLAPAFWFTATLLMTRGAKDWVRISALVVGALLLVPWPFVVAGGGAL